MKFYKKIFLRNSVQSMWLINFTSTSVLILERIGEKLYRNVYAVVFDVLFYIHKNFINKMRKQANKLSHLTYGELRLMNVIWWHEEKSEHKERLSWSSGKYREEDKKYSNCYVHF